MKKIIVVSAGVAFLIIACSKKSVPGSDQHTSFPKTEIKTGENKNTNAVESSTTPVSPVANTQSKSSDENVDMNLIDQGKMVFSTKCTRCHAMKNPGDFTASRWDNILKQMVPRAKLTSDEEKQVTAFVKANAKQ
jgi:hypothetical protein